MSWLKFTLPENIKKRVCIYLLQRYLGQFFEEKLTLDQLQIDLYNGTGKVECVRLDVQSLNELGEKQNWPLKFIDGYLEELSIYVPWKALLKESSDIEIKGLRLTLQPKERLENATSMFESMWSSMTSSMQLAQECMRQDEVNSANEANNGQQLEGIEKFAQLIDSVLKRVKIKFVDTILQFEHVPIDSMTGVALKIHIEHMEYWDLAGTDPPETDDTQEGTSSNQETKDNKKVYLVSSFTTKNFILQGITMYTVEFPIEARTHIGSSMHESVTEQSTVPTTSLDCEDIVKPMEKSNKTQLRHEIMFGKFIGRQTLMLRLKQSENQNGPKVSIELNSGSLLLFLSPRQVHVLLELGNGLAKPDLEDNTNLHKKQKCVEKPMTALDYQRVEQDLQQQLHPLNTFQSTGLQGVHGWSTAPLEDENEDVFYPMKTTSNVMCDSTLSNASSSMESSFTSSMASSSITEPSVKMKRKVANIESDPTAEISHFQIRLASLAVVLLHEDILTLASDGNQTLLPSSVKQMSNTSETFFKQIGLFAVSGYGANKDFEKANQFFEKACKLNHLRLLAANLQLEGNETTTQTAFSISGTFSTAKLELIECLHDSSNQETPISYVVWLKYSALNDTELQRPNLRLSFKHIQRNVRSGLVPCKICTKTDVSVNMEACQLEVDITIIDRINALLNPHPVCLINGPKVNKNWKNRNENTDKHIDSTTDFKIKVPNMLVNLRFPIPDFRPSHDMQKVPWWKRNVRPDYLQFNISEVTLQNETSTSRCSSKKYTMTCKACHLTYHENERSVPLSLAKTTSNELKQPKIVLEIFNSNLIERNRLQTNHQTSDSDDIMTQSIYGLLSPPTPKQGGPFSSKKVVHESDTPHARHPQDDPEEMVIPGDKQEMEDFIEKTINNCEMRLDVYLPIVTLQLVSKHIYEVIYNRINSDLLLWIPSAPKPKISNINLYECTLRSLDNLTTLDNTPETFAMCKSGIQYDSDSESDDDINPTGNSSGVFYSIYDTNAAMKQSHLHSANANNKGNGNTSIGSNRTKPVGSSAFALTLQIGQGLIYMHTPARDQSTNVIPNQQGEFCLLCNDTLIFSVNGFDGDEDLGYVCVQVGNAQLYHCEMMSMPSQSPPLKEVGTTLPKHLHPTIYESDVGTLTAAHGRGGNREMLSIAVKIQANHETHHVKTVRVAFGINKMTLKHRMCHEPNSWISQLIDFFNVVDYPIAGYNAKDVLTELHLHLWDCAIDYRPLHLPLRSLVTMASFSMSSHLSAQANTSTLRFIAEDCNLFLSSTKQSNNSKSGNIQQQYQKYGVDLKKDYVSVLDFDLFELSLRTNDKKSGINPHIDLRASNNIVHIRTCSDSGSALMQLITYFAMDGDLLPKDDEDVNSPFASPKHIQKEPEELVHVTPQDISNLSQEQHEHVNELIGEAMVEIVEETTPKRMCNKERINDPNGAQIFFFPDENHPISAQDVCNPLPQVTNELGDVTFLSTKNSDTDEEYCFVEADLYLGVVPRNGTPEIRWLTDDPVRVIENHFSIPVGKTDYLKPPKHYPTPVMRYTLCEMSLIWHMYGGNDFKTTEIGDDDQSNKSKKVNFASDINRGCLDVGYSNIGTGEVIFTNFIGKEKQKIIKERNWLINGGIKRDHNVLMELKLNKVKFQHELYPENTAQASRQVLLISEVEIRDRLESSQINKFLYQYTSQAKPKQTHANMIAIKAVHIRPDAKLMTQECCLKVSILPLRLNIDQDALLFLIRFFNELGGNDESLVEGENVQPSSKHNTPTHQPPIMTISINEDDEDDKKKLEDAHKLVDENLLILLEEEAENLTDETPNKSTVTTNNDSLPIYFRSLLFSPEVQIRLDYHGKRVDMTHGPLPGLLMGLGQLNCSELRLKRLSNRHGLLGIDKVLNYALQEWLNDIKKNQLPSLLGGVGPMHSLLQLFQGIRDLFWMPIEQYQKDGRIVRGLQRGASSFTTSTAMAALELTSRIIHLIQITAETAYDMMSPGPSVRRRKIKGHKRKYQQPQDIREGVANACLLVREGIGETADNFVRIASHEHEQKGYSGAVGGVLREIPSAMVKPIIIASEATSNVLGGMRSQLVPDARQEANQKWRSDDS